MRRLSSVGCRCAASGASLPLGVGPPPFFAALPFAPFFVADGCAGSGARIDGTRPGGEPSSLLLAAPNVATAVSVAVAPDAKRRAPCSATAAARRRRRSTRATGRSPKATAGRTRPCRRSRESALTGGGRRRRRFGAARRRSGASRTARRAARRSRAPGRGILVRLLHHPCLQHPKALRRSASLPRIFSGLSLRSSEDDGGWRALCANLVAHERQLGRLASNDIEKWRCVREIELIRAHSRRIRHGARRPPPRPPGAASFKR